MQCPSTGLPDFSPCGFYDKNKVGCAPRRDVKCEREWKQKTRAASGTRFTHPSMSLLILAAPNLPGTVECSGEQMLSVKKNLT
jgi:hypothetical protein